jgi:hypothetical protein
MKNMIINSVTHYENRSNICVQIMGEHNEYVACLNAIHKIAKKHNAQENIYENTPPQKTDRLGNIIALAKGNAGGTITFHSHSCSPKEAAQEIIDLANR